MSKSPRCLYDSDIETFRRKDRSWRDAAAGSLTNEAVILLLSR